MYLIFFTLVLHITLLKPSQPANSFVAILTNSLLHVLKYRFSLQTKYTKAFLDLKSSATDHVVQQSSSLFTGSMALMAETGSLYVIGFSL